MSERPIRLTIKWGRISWEFPAAPVVVLCTTDGESLIVVRGISGVWECVPHVIGDHRNTQVRRQLARLLLRHWPRHRQRAENFLKRTGGL